MGCIEMIEWKIFNSCGRRINRNMGCIEISRGNGKQCIYYRLIETWDVLKSWSDESSFDFCFGLIETWDVLKFLR